MANTERGTVSLNNIYNVELIRDTEKTFELVGCWVCVDMNTIQTQTEAGQLFGFLFLIFSSHVHHMYFCCYPTILSSPQPAEVGFL